MTAIGALERSCTSVATESECGTLLKTLAAHQVATLHPDQGGTAQSPELPSGRTYCLFGAVITGGKKFTWHLALPASAGWARGRLGPDNTAP